MIKNYLDKFFIHLYLFKNNFMPYDFYSLLANTNSKDLSNMPPIDISERNTDKKIVYNKNNNRLDRIAGDVYEDETLWRMILWANPEYDCEFDIPDNTVIRIPFPKNDILTEITTKIINRKDIA